MTEISNPELDAFLNLPHGLDDTTDPDVIETEMEPQGEEAAAPDAEQPIEADDTEAEVDDAPPASNKEDKTVPLSALQAERKERQSLKEVVQREEERNKALQARLDALEASQKAAPPAAPPPAAEVNLPDPISDPIAYDRAIQNRIQWESLNNRLNVSELLARQKYGDDLDKKVALFQEAAKRDPSLSAKVKSEIHPYEFVYEHGKKLEALAEVGDDPVSYKAKIEAEIRAKVMAELELAKAEPAPAAAAPALKVPASLGNVRSAGSRNAAPFTGPPSLSDLFPR